MAVGPVAAAGDEERSVYHEMKAMEKSSFTRINGFQDNIAQGRPNQWRCRAGARYLYICEDGLVHYCSQQRGYPGIPLEKYTVARHSPRVCDREILRPALHGLLRASGIDLRFLACAADSRCWSALAQGSSDLIQIR